VGALPELTEDEHQALDLLEAVDAGEDVDASELDQARASARALLERFVPAVAKMTLAALPPLLEAQRAHVDHKDRVLFAVERVASPPSDHADPELTWLDAIRELPVMALLQDDAAASELSGDALVQHLRSGLEDFSALTERALDRIGTDPALAWSFAPATAATRQLLAVPRGGQLERLLREGPAPGASKDPALERLGRVVTRLNRAGYLPTVTDTTVGPSARPPTAPELVRFRLESVRDAGNEVRARALAGDLPQRIDIAREVAKKGLEPARAIRAFAGAVEAAIADERQLEQPPTRRFTRLHLTLLLILGALTVWHYWLR
jgi:hypothetical protein